MRSGTMARLPQLLKVAKKFDLKIVSIEDLVSYRMQHDSLIAKKVDHEINTRYGKFRMRAYEQTTNGNVHLALTKGNWNKDEMVLTRIQSTKITNDILGMLTGSIHERLDDIFKLINEEKKGALLFINQEQSPEKTVSFHTHTHNTSPRIPAEAAALLTLGTTAQTLGSLTAGPLSAVF